MNAVWMFLSYLIGSIPFSFLITRIMTGQDIRKMGSGNVGATNVARTTGKVPGILALLLDVGKGAACVFLVRACTQSLFWAAGAGFFAMLGHSFPIFLKFRGGKS